MKKQNYHAAQKAAALLLSLTMGLSLAACGGTTGGSTADTGPTADATTGEAQAESTDAASGEKVHITYAF